MSTNTWVGEGAPTDDAGTEQPAESAAASEHAAEGFLPSPSSLPHQSTSMSKRWLAAGAAVVVLGGGAYAMTHLGSSKSATSASSASSAQGANGPGGFGGFGGTGGQGTGRGGFTPPVQGTITSVSSSAITVKTSSGTSATYTISSSTRIENNGATATADKLTVGERVVIFTGAGGPGGPGGQGATGATGSSGTTSTASSNAASMILAGSSATSGPGAQGGAGGTGGANGQFGQPPTGTAQNGTAQNGTTGTTSSATTQNT